MITAASAGHAFQLDVSPKPPQTIEEERRLRFAQHHDCAAAKGDASLCAMLEQQARQQQVDAVRRDTSPAAMPRPIDPDPLSGRGIPLSGGHQ